MAEIQLQAQPRTVLGKKVKRLRAAGCIPANVFGPGQPSLAIEIDARALRSTLGQLSRTALVQLHVAGEARPRPVLLRGIERRPTTHEILHLDFYQVPQGARVRLPVGLHFVGESPAAKQTDGAVVRQLDAIEVEGLPGQVPATIDVDLSQLASLQDVIVVGDLQVPADVTVLTPPETVVATVVAGRLYAAEEEAAAAAAPEAAEVAAETAETEAS
jgi:large subunit ribosomal protein L25